MTTKVEVAGEWGGKARRVRFDESDLGGFYVGVQMGDGNTFEHALVEENDFFEGLAQFLGKRISVADVEVIPATTKVTNEVVYGG